MYTNIFIDIFLCNCGFYPRQFSSHETGIFLNAKILNILKNYQKKSQTKTFNICADVPDVCIENVYVHCNGKNNQDS